MDYREKLRERFMAILSHKPQNMTAIAKDIGVSNELVRHFLGGARNTQLRSVSRIEAWIISQEKAIKK